MGHGFPDASEGRLRSKTLDLPIELRLFDKNGWQIKDGPLWLVASQPARASELSFRTWRAERLVRRTDCEAQARLVRPTLPVVREEAVVERRALAAPAGFDTELIVGVEPSARGIAGYALAIGSTVGGCYAALFTTEVFGPGADQEVAARLRQVADRVFASVRLRLVDERGSAVRRRRVSTPGAAQ